AACLLAPAPGEAAVEPPGQRVEVQLVVASPDASKLAVDDFVGDFEAVTDRGQTVRIPNEGTTRNTGSPMVILSSEGIDLRARSLKALSGKLRIYPKGEKASLSLDAREGAEARHPS